MKDFCERALEKAKELGASYADIRIVGRAHEATEVKNGKVEALAEG